MRRVARPAHGRHHGPWAGAGRTGPREFGRSPRKAHGGRSPRTTPRSPKAPAGGVVTGPRVVPRQELRMGQTAQEPSTTRTTIAPSPGDIARPGARITRPATRGIRGTAKGPRERRLAQHGTRRATHGAPTPTGSSTRSRGRSSGARRTTSPGKPQRTIMPALTRATSLPVGPPGGRRSGWRETPHGDAVRGLEVWKQALPVPQPCLQDRMPQVPGAEVNGQVGAPPRPSGEDMQVRGQDPPELHRSLPSVSEPHPAPGGRCGPVQPPR